MGNSKTLRLEMMGIDSGSKSRCLCDSEILWDSVILGRWAKSSFLCFCANEAFIISLAKDKQATWLLYAYLLLIKTVQLRVYSVYGSTNGVP